jgi:predicted transcriptional regulator
VNEYERALNGLIIMEKYSITSLFVINNKHETVGIVHLHDILKSGLKLEN